MSTITQKSVFDRALELIEESDDDDAIVPKAPVKRRGKTVKELDLTACREASRKLIEKLEEDDEPPKKRMREYTSYQEMDLDDKPSDDEEDVLSQTSILRRRREDQAKRVREAAVARAEITRALKESEDAKREEWRAKKELPATFAHAIELAPTDPASKRAKKSFFLITVTDNTQIIDSTLDTSDLWVIPQFDDLVKAYRMYVATTPLTSLLRAGNGNLKTNAAVFSAISKNVLNVVFRMTRERSPAKGQAHLHILAKVQYYNEDGFYPQINTDTLRDHFRTFAGEDGKRFYTNVTYIKDPNSTAKYYLTAPPGEKKEKKTSKSYTPSVSV